MNPPPQPCGGRKAELLFCSFGELDGSEPQHGGQQNDRQRLFFSFLCSDQLLIIYDGDNGFILLDYFEREAGEIIGQGRIP